LRKQEEGRKEGREGGREKRTGREKIHRFLSNPNKEQQKEKKWI
jgi:hypothetical protein